jgi:hypothetical protein
MSALTKLPTVLPQLVGKTIARTMLVFHADRGFQLWQFFTDGTSYEFYASNEISGARAHAAPPKPGSRTCFARS